MKNSTEALVSVIVSNYNHDRYIEEAVNSVLNQTYKNLQVIVVDDGSTDDSREILGRFSDPRLEIVYQENSGQAGAFNTGFQKCEGEFVAFLDSDDVWFAKKLELSIPEFNTGNISLVQHNLKLVDEDSQPIGGVNPGLPVGRLSIRDSYFKRNHTGFFSPTSGLVCRKRDLDEIFPLEFRWAICADVAISRPLPIFGDIVMLSGVLGAYRLHGNNHWTGTSESRKLVDNHFQWVEYTNEWLARHGYEERVHFEKSFRFKVASARCGRPSPAWVRFYVWARKLASSVPGLRKVYEMVTGRRFVNHP